MRTFLFGLLVVLSAALAPVPIAHAEFSSFNRASAPNPFAVGLGAEQCEWGGEYFNPGDTIRPDLWCVLTCEPSGDWRVDCEG